MKPSIAVLRGHLPKRSGTDRDALSDYRMAMSSADAPPRIRSKAARHHLAAEARGDQPG